MENNTNNNISNDRSATIIKVGAILSIIFGVLWCFTIIGLIWGIPMIILGNDDYKTGKASIALIVLGFIFSLISGIILLIGEATKKE